MDTLLSAAVVLAGITMTAALFALFIAVCVGFLALLLWWFFTLLGQHPKETLKLERHEENPVLGPNPEHSWESQAVFNPAAFVHNNQVHLLYRAIGDDGVSRIGYAKSDDGVHFERLDTPAYDPSLEQLRRAAAARAAVKKLSYETLCYDTVQYGSGGGWGGSEDPRAVVIDGRVCMTFTSFEGWNNVRIMLTSLLLSDLEEGLFNWDKGVYLSPPNETQKNWVLFPEKIRGKYALLHNISPTIEIAYLDPKSISESGYIKSYFKRNARKGAWDTWVRGAGAPPIRTKEGWLLLYHAIDEKDPNRYKVGAMLLDLQNPKKILYRSEEPILEPDAWYENDWKPGVVYASGAVVFGDDLIVYYGGGDKYIAAAKINLEDLLKKLTTHQHAQLEPVKM